MLFSIQSEPIVERIGPDDLGVTVIQVNKQAYRRNRWRLFVFSLAAVGLVIISLATANWYTGSDLDRQLYALTAVLIVAAFLDLLNLWAPFSSLRVSADGIEKISGRNRLQRGQWDHLVAVDPLRMACAFFDGEEITLGLGLDEPIRPEDMDCIAQHSGEQSLLWRAWSDNKSAPRANPLWGALFCISLFSAMILLAQLGYIAGCAYYRVPPELEFDLPIYFFVVAAVAVWPFTYYASTRCVSIRERWLRAKMKDGCYGKKHMRRK